MFRFCQGVTLSVTAGFAILLASVAVAQDELKVGDKAPDFEVDTFGDKTVKLSERFGDDGRTTVLLFSRANW